LQSEADDDDVQSTEWPGLEIKHHLTEAAMHQRASFHRQRSLGGKEDRDLRTIRSF
jgi:hypothetical protein